MIVRSSKKKQNYELHVHYDIEYKKSLVQCAYTTSIASDGIQRTTQCQINIWDDGWMRLATLDPLRFLIYNKSCCSRLARTLASHAKINVQKRNRHSWSMNFLCWIVYSLLHIIGDNCSCRKIFLVTFRNYFPLCKQNLTND